MKYYKWMLRMAVPAAAITVLIFTVPIGLGSCRLYCMHWLPTC